MPRASALLAIVVPVLGVAAGATCERPRPPLTPERTTESPAAIQPAPTSAPSAAAPPSTETVFPNTQITSFASAKRMLREVYAEHRVTLYCGCTYDEAHQVDHASCGYVPGNDTKRAQRVEWEHIVPAEAFGNAFEEWRDGDPACVDKHGKAFKGRNCARKASEAFRRMEADMYNLVPAIGEVNGRRSNATMGMIEGEERAFGDCDIEIADGTVEPRPEIRGDIARTYLYMDAAYPGRGVVSRKNRNLFAAWSEDDPVDAWECERARRIAAIQGNENPIVRDACAAAGR